MNKASLSKLSEIPGNTGLLYSVWSSLKMFKLILILKLGAYELYVSWLVLDFFFFTCLFWLCRLKTESRLNQELLETSRNIEEAENESAAMKIDKEISMEVNKEEMEMSRVKVCLTNLF